MLDAARMISFGCCWWVVCIASAAMGATSGVDKTLVAWASPANLEQQGGSVLTVQSGDAFDAIVLGERIAGRWMAGSDMFHRTQAKQHGNPRETHRGPETVQIAIVYTADHIRIYRDGEAYASYQAANIDLLGHDNHIAVFGLRHIGARSGSPFVGTIDDARIYKKALTQDEIRALRPNEPSAEKPLAWWDFEGESVLDRTGHFKHQVLMHGAKVENGRLVLKGTAHLVAALTEADAAMATRADRPRPPIPPFEPHTPAWPTEPPSDWLTFHLAHPGPGNAMPGDPNCIFDYNGRYHLHYIYNHQGFVFGHLSSTDMVYWRWQPTVLAPQTTGHGMFSGTGFFTKEGKPAIIYHGQGSDRNWIQYGLDDGLNTWSEPVLVMPLDENGNEPAIRHWDPDLWLMNGAYYAYSGGHNPQLMKSDDLKNWTYLGDLLHPDYSAQRLGVPREEDISCGNMFRIGDKWMLLCISHTLGARYYLGDFKDEKYLPTFHAVMSFGGNQFFAPESMLTRDGRRVMWAWLLNMPIAPSGVQSLPRELELPEDGVLRIRPLRELAKLRHDAKERHSLIINAGDTLKLDEVRGDAVELQVTFTAPIPESCGLHLLADDQGDGGMSIVAGAGRGSLRIGTIDVPFELKQGEDLTLRVFIDKNLVEVFANDRQAAVYAHAHRRNNPGVQLFADGGNAAVKSVKAWRMRSIYRSADQ